MPLIGSDPSFPCRLELPLIALTPPSPQAGTALTSRWSDGSDPSSPSGWNCLDFTVVCMGILELTNLGNYTFIRCFRALRPLRAITKIESLRVGHVDPFSY